MLSVIYQCLVKECAVAHAKTKRKKKKKQKKMGTPDQLDQNSNVFAFISSKTEPERSPSNCYKIRTVLANKWSMVVVWLRIAGWLARLVHGYGTECGPMLGVLACSSATDHHLSPVCAVCLRCKLITSSYLSVCTSAPSRSPSAFYLAAVFDFSPPQPRLGRSAR